MSQVDQTFNLIGAGRHLGVKPQTVRYWILTGKLKADFVNGRWVIRQDDLEAADKLAKSGPRPGRRGKRGTLVPIAEK